MAGQGHSAFPLVVRGDWGTAEPPPGLRKKLLCYFQSQKRSGGGECELRAGTGHLLVFFACPEVRQRVLDRRVHELDWGPRGRLSLLVTELPADRDPPQEPGRDGRAEAPVNEPEVGLPTSQNKETSVCTPQEKTELLEEWEMGKANSKKSVIVVTAAPGEEIEDEIVEMYFENKKKSGGGAIQSFIRKDQQIIITFQDEEDAQEVLQRKHHSVKKIDLLVEPCREDTVPEPCREDTVPELRQEDTVPEPCQEDTVPEPCQEDTVPEPCQEDTLQEPHQEEASEGSLPSTIVVLENVQEAVKDCMLIMLVENISGLSEDDGDFSVEMIPEIHAAAVTFTGNIAAGKFAEKLNQHHRAKQQNITARCLEQTKSVRAENIPPHTHSDYITLYFENKKNGGAEVEDVQQLPEEDAAIITFKDHKDVSNVLAKQHSLNRTPISVYPYYPSLGTALYGKEEPQIKKPDPVTVPLDPYIWYYLQRKDGLIEAVNREMAKCNCVPTWPKPYNENPKVTLSPSATLSEKKRLVSLLIKTWNENVSTAFSSCISKYRAAKYQVSAEVWEAIRNSFSPDEVVVIPCISKDLLVVVGEEGVVKNAEQELKLLLEKATREIEREKQRTEEMVIMGPGEYAILQSTGLEEKVRRDFPALQITYDHVQKIVNLCGMPEEVYKVKGEILDNTRKIAKKMVNIHPYIFKFLERVDNETLSQSLFMSRQINAFYELGREAVILKGWAPEDLLKAEETIKEELDHKSIALEDKSILQKEEWKMLTKYNCSNEALTVTEEESQVVIAGFSRAVAKAFEDLYNFIDENTQVRKVIGRKPMAVIMFFEKEKTTVWGDLQTKGVKVDFSTERKNRVISLSGPRREVLKGVTLVEDILSGLHYRRVVIREPGAKSYFKEREHYFAATAKQDFKCLIRLEDQSEEQQEEEQEWRNRGKHCRQVTIGGVVVSVIKGNLCAHPVDVVVNASNEDLKHIGGLADALLRAAGPELQQECDELVKKNGSLQPGCAVITGAGKLPCKNVIHAVGPRWRKEEAEKCVFLLRKTVKKSLQLAETYNHRSIAVPAVSAGVFGFPLELCTYSIVSSIRETLEQSMGDSSLKEVHLMDISQNNVDAFSKALREVFADDSASYVPPYRTRTVYPPRKKKCSQNSKNFPLLTTEEGLDIILKKGSIEGATTDVVVISVAPDLNLSKGLLAKTLLSKAGPMLQSSLREEGLKEQPMEGSVLKTKGYNLDCSVVLHAVLPAWSQRNTSSKVFGDIVTKCLEIAEELSLKSITFPAMGTGVLRYPGSVVAKILFDKVFEYSGKKGLSSLEEVHFLLHPKDVTNIEEFSRELQNRSGNVKLPKISPDKASKGTDVSGAISSLAGNGYEMRIGSVVFQVEKGDITSEKGDVIVNITNQTFSLKTGVSRAILSSAGKAVEDECAQLASQSNKSYITTQAGNLSCKKIIHCVAQDDIKAIVSRVLKECELQQYTSVAFPAIGTGEAGRDPAVVADNMIDAVTDFARTYSAPSVRTVKVVIFQPHLLDVFHRSMKKRENPAKTTGRSLLSRIMTFCGPERRSPKEKVKTQPIFSKKIEMAVMQICGENQKKVEEAENWLKSAILKEQHSMEIKDESVIHFGEVEHEELQKLQNVLKIALSVDGTSIHISGVEKDVWIAHSSVQKMIHAVKAAKQEEIKAELLQNLIQWKYLKNDLYVPFSSLTNMYLEEAFRNKQKVISVMVDEKKYTADIDTRCILDDQGRSRPIIRIDKSEDQESVALPATWDDMQNQRLRIVELKPETKEYKDVQEKFQKSCLSYKIEKIERIQNPYFWKTYQIKKREMDNKNGNRNNEKHLFHGTSKDSVTLINNYGFNRSYAGTNGANYGNGTYFAVNANYSASDSFSRPDAFGKKHMYLARVLVGEYSQGSRGSITPAAKNASNSVDLFDSSTDNMQNPSMFIIFNDIQAYPEYLITFTR